MKKYYHPQGIDGEREKTVSDLPKLIVSEALSKWDPSLSAFFYYYTLSLNAPSPCLLDLNNSTFKVNSEELQEKSLCTEKSPFYFRC